MLPKMFLTKIKLGLATKVCLIPVLQKNFIYIELLLYFLHSLFSQSKSFHERIMPTYTH